MGIFLALIAAALVFGGGGGSSGGSTAHAGASCTSITLTKASLTKAMGNTRAIVVGLGPSDGAIELVRRIMRSVAPDCSWSDSMIATVTTPDGKSFAWQDVVSRLRGVTIADAANDSELQRILSGMKTGREGASKYNEIQLIVYQDILMALARDAPVPYVPNGRKWGEFRHWFRWSGLYFETQLYNDGRTWAANAYLDLDATKLADPTTPKSSLTADTEDGALALSHSSTLEYLPEGGS